MSRVPGRPPTGRLPSRDVEKSRSNCSSWICTETYLCVVPPASVPVNRIEPFVAKLADLKVVKKGFEVIDADTSEVPTGNLSREARKRQRDERKKQRDKRRQLD